MEGSVRSAQLPPSLPAPWGAAGDPWALLKPPLGAWRSNLQLRLVQQPPRPGAASGCGELGHTLADKLLLLQGPCSSPALCSAEHSAGRLWAWRTRSPRDAAARGRVRLCSLSPVFPAGFTWTPRGRLFSAMPEQSGPPRKARRALCRRFTIR